MTATNQNLSVYIGDYVEIEVPVRDEDFNPVKLEEVKARYKISSDPTNEPLIIKNNEPGGALFALTERDTLTLLVRIYPEDFNNINRPGTYYHEAEVMDECDRPFTVMTGRIKLLDTLIS